MIAQRVSGVLRAESATALKDGRDVVRDGRQLIGQCRSRDGGCLDGACVLPSDYARRPARARRFAGFQMNRHRRAPRHQLEMVDEEFTVNGSTA
jgi:hypothetical protein